ncbi:hypothetical protein K474DRAFT_1710404 [Panus rudis PR-1116 ss-1]|nr:hypothetical protein K474DRAFT_1710404 [Panus rudis PR-1116 ss-1]
MDFRSFLTAYTECSSSVGLPRMSAKSTFIHNSTLSTIHEIETQLMLAISKHGLCSHHNLERHTIITDDHAGRAIRLNLCLYSRNEVPGVSSDWVNMEFFVDIHADQNEDPFRHAFASSGHSLRSKREETHKEALACLETYLRAQFSRQHRTFTFALCIFGRYARVLRIDRAGVVVTEAINYIQNFRLLAEFFWRYNQLSRSQRGFDSSVIPATSDEKDLLTKAVLQYLKAAEEGIVRRYPTMESALAKDSPTYKIEMIDRYTGEPTHYIVRKPCVESAHVLGRATRGFVAFKTGPSIQKDDYDVTPPLPLAKNLVFVKDYWRRHSCDSPAESDLLDKLEDLEIPHVPVSFTASDVYTEGQAQVTKSHLLSNARSSKWRRPCQVCGMLVHHRIVQQLSFPLSTVKDARELVQVVRDALQALIDAYMKARILHRDVSSNNILISSSDAPAGEGRGLLNDWDVAHKIEPGSTVRPSRAGTWRFMSMELLYNKEKDHEIVDDLESMFWVLLYNALHHCKHTGIPPRDLFDEVFTVFKSDGTPETSGGVKKHAFLRKNTVVFSCPALNDLITSLRTFWFRFHSSHSVRDPELHRRLRSDPSELLELFDLALRKGPEAWVNSESTADQYPHGGITKPSPVLLTTLAPCNILPAVDILRSSSDKTIAGPACSSPRAISTTLHGPPKTRGQKRALESANVVPIPPSKKIKVDRSDAQQQRKKRRHSARLHARSKQRISDK